MQIRRENRGRGREDRSTCHRMSTHDRSRVGRGINMKSCRLIYDPGTGRPLLDLWRYPLFPPPSLPPGKRRLYFLSACDGAESSVNFLFFKTFSLNFASYSFARFIQLEKDRAYLIFFTLSVATIDEIDKISRYLELREIFIVSNLWRRRGRNSTVRKLKGMIEMLRV